ncbi:MAG: hypothetical protein QXS02_05615 [Candidatus Thermoplasmatota archaeon]
MLTVICFITVTCVLVPIADTSQEVNHKGKESGRLREGLSYILHPILSNDKPILIGLPTYPHTYSSAKKILKTIHNVRLSEGMWLVVVLLECIPSPPSETSHPSTFFINLPS